MSTLFEISGDMRGGVILAAVQRIVHEERRPTPAEIDAICRDLPGWSDCGDDECAAALEMIDQAAEAHAATLEAEQLPQDVSTEPQAEKATDEPGPLPPVDRDAALATLKQAERALADARGTVTALTHKRQELRGRLADAIMAWTSGLPKMTHTQAVKEAVATHQATRAERAGRSQPGPSRIDRERFYSQGGDGNDFLRKQMGRGHRRFRPGDVMTKQGIRARLPSER
jgi:hypothetical protein